MRATAHAPVSAQAVLLPELHIHIQHLTTPKQRHTHTRPAAAAAGSAILLPLLLGLLLLLLLPAAAAAAAALPLGRPLVCARAAAAAAAAGAALLQAHARNDALHIREARDGLAVHREDEVAAVQHARRGRRGDRAAHAQHLAPLRVELVEQGHPRCRQAQLRCLGQQHRLQLGIQHPGGDPGVGGWWVCVWGGGGAVQVCGECEGVERGSQGPCKHARGDLCAAL
jgi:hypothetical protein